MGWPDSPLRERDQPSRLWRGSRKTAIRRWTLRRTLPPCEAEGDRWFIVDYKTDSTARRLEPLVEYYWLAGRTVRALLVPTHRGLNIGRALFRRWLHRALVGVMGGCRHHHQRGSACFAAETWVTGTLRMRPTRARHHGCAALETGLYDIVVHFWASESCVTPSGQRDTGR